MFRTAWRLKYALLCSGCLLLGFSRSMAFLATTNPGSPWKRTRQEVASTPVQRVVEERQETDDRVALARALERAHVEEMERYATQKEAPWFVSSDSDTLPFDCTACGKCCKTKGNVYMSPSEVSGAARVLKMTDQDFIETYASLVLESNDSDKPWIRLNNNNDGDACIFLDNENKCQIYEARPVQCSTYPFWTNVMSSQESWNAEVRMPDNDLPTEATTIPYWTASSGGCEGMQIVDDDNLLQTQDGVSVQEAYQRLKMYERSQKVFLARRSPRALNF